VNRYYASQQGRFNQPDPLRMGAASLADPQSLNLYSYVRNDPVNSVDPSGLNEHPAGVVDGGGVYCSAQYSGEECGGLSGLMSGNYGDRVAEYNREYGGLPEEAVDALRKHNERIANARAGKGFRTNEEIDLQKQKQERERRSRLVPPPVGVLVSAEVVAAAVALVVAIIVAATIVGTTAPHSETIADIHTDEERTQNDIYVFKPFKVRERVPDGQGGYRGDIERDQNGDVDAQSGPLPKGKSFFGDPNEAPLNGPYYRIPKGAVLPVGTNIIADGRDVYPNSPHAKTHHTLFPTVKMPFDTFNTLVLDFIQKNAIPAGIKKR
jgi:hypothetical protein